MSAVTNCIKDGYLGIKGNDWVKTLSELSQQAKDQEEKITAEVNAQIEAGQKSAEAFNPALYTGSFSDKWFGDVIISLHNNKLWLASVRSPRLTGELLPYKGNTLIVKWKDRSFDADAFVKFNMDMDGKATGMKMEAISPLTDFSYDFQDLDFTRNETESNNK